MGTHEKMLQMQMQIRENSNEIQDYLQGLDSWETDIKKQDTTFTKMKPKQETKFLAPVRSGTKKKKKKLTDDKSCKIPKRIKSYDFQSWDKLDFDKMLDEMEAEEEEVEPHETTQKQEQIENELKKLSLDEKNKGNDHFKAGRYDKSVECYTKGMQHDPSNPVLPANRAMGYLKIHKYVESEADCTLALSLDPVYVKAYLRRGAARKALGKVESAMRDFNDVLKLEPENKQARQELENIKKQDQKFSKTTVKEEDAAAVLRGVVRPIYKPEHLRSKKPLRRVPVEEVGRDVDGLGDRLNDDLPLEVKEQQRRTVDDSIQVVVPDLAADCEKITHQRLNIPNLPSTSFQFQADMRKLRSYPGTLFKYVSQLEPSSVPSLLKDQLDTETLLNIINSFRHSTSGNQDYIISFLRFLSLCKRFDMALMFLSRSDKQDLQNLFDKLKEASPHDKLISLSSAYGLSIGSCIL